MEFADIFLVGVLVFGAVKGFMKGFVVEIFSLAAFFVGLFIAIEFTIPLTMEYFGDHAWFPVISIAVFLAIFLVITLLISITAKLIKKALHLTFFGVFDSIFGAILGVIKWALVISVVLWVFKAVGISLPKEYVDDSLVFPLIAAIGPTAFEWAGAILPFFGDIFDSLEKIEKKAV
jgi:membrane protein required for colicin V production